MAPIPDHRNSVLRAFEWAAVRRVSRVDVDPTSSNQHELGSVAALREHLLASGRIGDVDRATVRTHVLWLVDDHEPVLVEGSFTLYDARAGDPRRSAEWRLYYGAGSGLEDLLQTEVRPGDVMVYAVPVSDQPDAVVLVAPRDSQWARILGRLFPVDGRQQRLRRVDDVDLTERNDRASARLIAEQLGLAVFAQSDLEFLRAELGHDLSAIPFPDTATMARLSRRRLGAIGADPDDLLVALLEAETRLFYALEAAQGRAAFDECVTVEDHLATAKSMLQRRRSRRGYSFENHLAQVFTDNGLAFERQVRVEGSRIDFLFPGIEEYEQSVDPNLTVVQMNAKTTARERWTQILHETPRLRTRHLGTLDPDMSLHTLEEMIAHDVRVVMPSPMSEAYPDEARSAMWTVGHFVEQVRVRQRG